MKRKLGFLAMLAVIASSFTACCDFPIDPFPPDDGTPVDTLDNGWPDGNGGCDTLIIDENDTLVVGRGG